jgi:hypothetical protein
MEEMALGDWVVETAGSKQKGIEGIEGKKLV